MTSVGSITTAEQLLAAGHGIGRCELIRGALRMMSPAGGRHGRIAMALGHGVWEHVQKHSLGAVYAAETGFILERNPDTVRAPDVAFIATARLAEADTAGFIPIAPDFVAEVLSPDDRASKVGEKVQWWLDHGVRLVWVVDPRTRTVTAHTPDGRSQRFRETDTLEGGDVLPGLALAATELFS